MAENSKRASAENVTKGNSGDVYEEGLHPLKGKVKKDKFRDNDSSKDRLDGLDKEIFENQVQTATDNSNKRVADNIQNTENKQ